MMFWLVLKLEISYGIMIFWLVLKLEISYGAIIIELSVKQEKHTTRTLSLVIHRVRLKKKNLQKKYISIQRGMKLRKPSILVIN